MSAIKVLNPKAEIARAAQALAVNMSAAKGLQEVLRTNLGPRGTMKMLVSGAGDIKITKDGNVLLNEMQIQHPTASLIARVATAQDDVTGDGTTSNVLIIGELIKQAELYVSEGLHPRLVTEGFMMAKEQCLKYLDDMKVLTDRVDREVLCNVARTSLRSKVHHELADKLTDSLVDAILAIRQTGKPLDLHMIEIMEMMHKMDVDTQLVKGIVMDHGSRHPDMPKKLEGEVFVLTCNVSLEYEKTEVNSGFFYKTAEERQKFVKSERLIIDEHVNKLIALKREVCGDDPNKGFLLVNQKGIDPMSLDALAKENIIGLRRAKRRNMERLTLACGGQSVNSFDELGVDCLGKCGSVYETVLGEDKYTFVEECNNPMSVTVLVRGPNKHTLTQIKDAIHDGLRSIKNAIEDNCVIPGAGAFEVYASQRLIQYKAQVQGRAKLGIQAFADALLIIPKVLAQNAGHDAQDAIVTLIDAQTSEGWTGIDLKTGRAMDPVAAGIFDNYCVKRQLIHSSTVIATNLLLVDEIMKAGMSSLKG
jgi:T-complex protein 1 subunit zeta